MEFHFKNSFETQTTKDFCAEGWKYFAPMTIINLCTVFSIQWSFFKICYLCFTIATVVAFYLMRQKMQLMASVYRIESESFKILNHELVTLERYTPRDILTIDEWGTSFEDGKTLLLPDDMQDLPQFIQLLKEWKKSVH